MTAHRARRQHRIARVPLCEMLECRSLLSSYRFTEIAGSDQAIGTLGVPSEFDDSAPQIDASGTVAFSAANGDIDSHSRVIGYYTGTAANKHLRGIILIVSSFISPQFSRPRHRTCFQLGQAFQWCPVAILFVDPSL